jgi:hypothetical protein
MSQSKYKRDKKKQLGQFMTPESLAYKLINLRDYKITDKILEPSFGRGGFLFPIIDKLIEVYPKDLSDNKKLDLIFENNLFGVELDSDLYLETLNEIEKRYSYKLGKHNLVNSDFFLVEYDILFDYCEGNPPFGGTFETHFGEKLDKIFGYRNNMKIKKETYSFFTVKCCELLKDNGIIGFICSNTFLSISTMKGLRFFLLKNDISIHNLSEFSDETSYGMVYFTMTKNNKPSLKIDNKLIDISSIYNTGNYSFLISDENNKFFDGERLSKYITCSSGMTTGKNDLFLKEVINNRLIEKYKYTIIEEPKTYEKELKRTKFGKISSNKLKEIEDNKIEKILIVEDLDNPTAINLPNENYFPYNKSSSEEIYDNPTSYIIWKNDGEAVKTYKKTGPWYLHGIGGEKFFKKEGFTWRLISDDIRVRYLPGGYILDSGAPVGVLKDGIPKEELFFIIGWLLTSTATNILKKTINHTKNIQSKDIEKLPYPDWVSNENKKLIISYIKELINNKMNGEKNNPDYKTKLNFYFANSIF